MWSKVNPRLIDRACNAFLGDEYLGYFQFKLVKEEQRTITFITPWEWFAH